MHKFNVTKYRRIPLKEPFSKESLTQIAPNPVTDWGSSTFNGTLVKMHIKIDREADAIYPRLSDAEVAESDEDKPGIIIDYDKDGKIVRIELLDASQRTENPASVVYEAA